MNRIAYLAAAALMLVACMPDGPQEVVATAIKLSKNELTLEKGSNEILTVTFTPSNATDKSLIWVSSNKSIAEVTDGIVVGVNVGSTEIIVKHGDLTDRCTVTVKAAEVPVTGVSIDMTSLTMTEGDTLAVTATVSPDNATDKSVTWSSDNTTVVTVSSSGVVTAIKAGTATITVKTNDSGKTATCAVTVKAAEVPVTGISIDMTSLTMMEGDTLALTATVSPDNATDKSVTWSSDNTTVVTVSSSGVVTAIKAGTATITVKTNDGGKTATCAVTVQAASSGQEAVDLGLPSGIKWGSCNIGASKPEEYGDYYAWGETETKSNYGWSNYKWSDYGTNLTKYNTVDNKTVLESSDDVAHVSLGEKWRMPTDDEWTELREKCTWTWTTQNGVDGVKITGPNGNSLFLPATGVMIQGYGFYWSSSLVDTDNPIYAYGVSFYSSFSGDYLEEVGRDFSGRCYGEPVRPVYGDVLVSSVNLNYTSLTMTEGETQTLTATVKPDNATDKSVTWSSDNTTVVTVSSSGVVTAIKAGNATITIKPNDGGKAATCAVTVQAASSGQEAVDLGLPSGLKWGSCNIGASKSEEYGDYYAWGETETKSDYSWATYKWCNGPSSYNPNITNSLTKYNTDSSYGTVDKKIRLEYSDDVAHVSLGGKWRMPTYGEWEELLTKCTWTWTTINGERIRKVTGPNGNSIFLPDAGCRGGTNLYDAGSEGDYWSSNLSFSRPDVACNVEFDSGEVGRFTASGRFVGFSVRPVYDASIVSVTSVSLDKTSLTMTEGDTQTLTATVTPNNATEKSVTWSSNNTSVAEVSNTGIVTAKKAGAATITVKTIDGGKTATCLVTVELPPTPEAIDLGLPSGLKWGSCNIGASSPEEYGNCYAWGETETKTDYSWSTYKWCNGTYNSLTKYNTSSSYGTVDNITVLDPEDDVAHVKFGGKWRMPTDEDWTELRENCTWTWTTQNGVNGRLVTSKKNGNSIFLPAAGYPDGTSLYRNRGSWGYYWSSSLNTGSPYRAWSVRFYSRSVDRGSYDYNDSRATGFSVRPVSD